MERHIKCFWHPEYYVLYRTFLSLKKKEWATYWQITNFEYRIILYNTIIHFKNSTLRKELFSITWILLTTSSHSNWISTRQFQDIVINGLSWNNSYWTSLYFTGLLFKKNLYGNIFPFLLYCYFFLNLCHWSDICLVSFDLKVV